MEKTGSAKGMGFRATPLALMVSLVLSLSIFAMAPMSPVAMLLTSSMDFLPRMIYIRPIFSLSPVRLLVSGASPVRGPLMTLT